jgi:hypothetical protein
VIGSFVRLTVTIAALILGLIVALFVLKLFIGAAVIAALGVAVLFVVNLIRAAAAPRSALPRI